MESKSALIAIFTSDNEEKLILAESLSEFKVSYTYATNMHDLKENLYEHPSNGILFSIASLIGLDHGSKTFIQTLEHIYPVARIRWNRAKGTFALISSQSGRVETISDFLMICADFDPRRLRRSERLSSTLNSLISHTRDLAEPERTFTTNISMRGCFIHTTQEWSVGDPVFIQIQELPGKDILEGAVVRYVPWGTPYRVQGIGIQFVNCSESQNRELRRLLSIETE
jgi:Tfp pilus assembly protein PilZ